MSSDLWMDLAAESNMAGRHWEWLIQGVAIAFVFHGIAIGFTAVMMYVSVSRNSSGVGVRHMMLVIRARDL